MPRPQPEHTQFVPRPFAMVVDGPDPRAAVAWGMTLPDGSAVLVDWRRGPSSVTSVCRTPFSAERLFDDAALVWIRDDGTMVDDLTGEPDQARDGAGGQL